MISDFAALLSWVVTLFKIEFTIYGFTFSMWEVFLFDIAVGIVVFIVAEVLLGD